MTNLVDQARQTPSMNMDSLERRLGKDLPGRATRGDRKTMPHVVRCLSTIQCRQMETNCNPLIQLGQLGACEKVAKLRLANQNDLEQF